jgi:predicted neuraminidase
MIIQDTRSEDLTSSEIFPQPQHQYNGNISSSIIMIVRIDDGLMVFCCNDTNKANKHQNFLSLLSEVIILTS